MDDLIQTREELVARREQLGELKVPVITARMRHAGLRTRPHRQEISRYKKEILKQRQFYGRKITEIEKYLKTQEEIGEGEPLVPPRVSMLGFPKLAKTRIMKTKKAKLRRLKWF